VAILISSYLNINLRKILTQHQTNIEADSNDPLCHSKYALNYPVCVAKLLDENKKTP
jgi:hypothetical protein